MLTPIDIQNHSLKTAVRGYSKKETDDFLEEILKGYEELYKENRELKEKMSSLSEGIQYYKQMENTLQKALVLAEKTSSETQVAAQTKADALVGESQAKADAVLKESQAKAEALLRESQAKSEAILQEAHAKAEAMRKEIQAYSDITKSKANRELEDTRNHVRKLVQSYENYRLQFKKLAESQIEMLESKHYSIFAPELAEMLDGAPDADEVMDAERTVPINVSKEEYLNAAESTSEMNVEANSTPSTPTEDMVAEVAPSSETVAVSGAAIIGADTVAPGNGTAAISADMMPPGNGTASISADTVAPGNEAASISADTVVPGNEAASISADTVVPGNGTVAISADTVASGDGTAAISADMMPPGSGTVAPTLQAEPTAIAETAGTAESALSPEPKLVDSIAPVPIVSVLPEPVASTESIFGVEEPKKELSLEEEERARAMAEIQIPDMEITADTIVPGIKPPKKEEASPFTFIDTE